MLFCKNFLTSSERDIMYEIYCSLRDAKNVKDSDVAKYTQIPKSTFSDWKSGKSSPKLPKLQKIADYFGVTIDYLMTGEKKEVSTTKAELTAKDEREIGRDLDRIMNEIKKGEDGPLFYNGVEMDEKSLILLENAIEYALRESKKENKVKYNPHKNKK